MPYVDQVEPVCCDPCRYKLAVDTGCDAQTQTDPLLCECGNQDTGNSLAAEVQELQQENEVGHDCSLTYCSEKDSGHIRF